MAVVIGLQPRENSGFGHIRLPWRLETIRITATAVPASGRFPVARRREGRQRGRSRLLRRRANRAWRLSHLIARHPVDNPPIDFHPAPPPELPTFALWPKHDGLLAIARARALPHDRDRQVELDCPPLGFPY